MSADTAGALLRTVANLEKLRDMLRDGDMRELLIASLLDFEVNKLSALLELERFRKLKSITTEEANA